MDLKRAQNPMLKLRTLLIPNWQAFIKKLYENDGTAIGLEQINQFRQYSYLRNLYIRRCESALGHNMYIKASRYLKSNRGQTDANIIREHLISM